MKSPTINLYISPRDIQLVSDGHPVQARNNRDGTTHLVQVSFPLDNYEIIPSVNNLGLFSVIRR